MRICRPFIAVLVVGAAAYGTPTPCAAQCCLSELFAGCRKAPAAYAVAPVAAPVMAPMAAPIPAPPPPVVVPVQQVSYVPETTYRTQYQCVPVTSYKPSSEIDPCTGCPRECMEQVTQYVQQAVNVPVTQYRAVYSTKYVQMQPGYGATGGYGTPAATAPMMAPASAGAATSPFASTVQTTPQAWGAAQADVPQQLIQPGQPQNIGAPALAPAMVPQQGLQQPVYQQPAFQQPVVPQGGTYATPAPSAVQPQPTPPPTLSPTPSLRPIPDLQRTPAGGTSTSGSNGMPVLPGGGPGAATGAFPKLLEPTGHTTSWQPGARAYPFTVARPPAYPTATLPGRVQ